MTNVLNGAQSQAEQDEYGQRSESISIDEAIASERAQAKDSAQAFVNANAESAAHQVRPVQDKDLTPIAHIDRSRELEDALGAEQVRHNMCRERLDVVEARVEFLEQKNVQLKDDLNL